MRNTVFFLALLLLTFLASSMASAQAVLVTPRVGDAVSSRDVNNYPTHSSGNEFEIAKASAKPASASPGSTSPNIAYAAKLKHDADELAYLAQSVPADVDQTTKGLLPQDLAKKLKRIQELSKQLRSQISQ
ncbi:MAG TPA: hypothetical protein VF753_13620 [Terriglobales bacterium]